MNGVSSVLWLLKSLILFANSGKGGKNRRRGKNENESEKRELVFKEDGQGSKELAIFSQHVSRSSLS